MHVKIPLSAALFGLLLVSAIPSYAETNVLKAQANAVEAWKNKIVAQLTSKGVLPPGVGDGGTAEVKFVIDRQGKLISRALVKSSGSALLDAAALTMVERAEPFPRPPAKATDDMLTFMMPVTFASRNWTSAIAAWKNKIVAQLMSKGVFPPTVRDGGTVEVKFVIDRQGKLISRALVKSSGSELFDAAALTTVEQAEPFPEAPAEVSDDMLTFVLPFDFARKGLSWAEQEAKVKAKVNGVCRGC